MRRRAAAVLVAVVVAAGLGACGNDEDGGSRTDAGGRPLLPVGLGGGGAGVAADAVATAEAAGGGAARSMLAGAAPTEYRIGDGVEAPATEAPAYRFVPEADDDARAKLTKALGADGRTATLEVRHGNWYFSSNDAGAVGVAATDECKILADGSCEEKPLPPPPPGVPTAEEAEAKLRRLLGQIGIDASSGRIAAVESGEPVYQRVASFEPTVDGLPLKDLTTTVGFGADGRLEFANGYIGTFEKVGVYPLVGLAEALERYQAGFVGGDARTSTGVGVAEPAIEPAPAADTPIASDGRGTTGSAGSSPGSPGSAGRAGAGGQTEPGFAGDAPPAPDEAPPVDLPTPTPGPIEPVVIEVTGAELVLTPVYPRCEGGDLYLVPSFQLQPEAAGFAVPAVEESSVAEPATSEESSRPCPDQPEPDEPVGRPEPAPVPPDASGREPATP